MPLRLMASAFGGGRGSPQVTSRRLCCQISHTKRENDLLEIAHKPKQGRILWKNSYRVEYIRNWRWLLVFETGNHNGILQMKIDRRSSEERKEKKVRPVVI